MNLSALALLVTGICICLPYEVRPALSYLSNQQLESELKGIAREHRDLVRVQSITRSLKKNDVWSIEIGTGEAMERKQRPALLLVAGLEGNDLAGTAVAVEWVKALAKRSVNEPGLRELLSRTTIYVFPRVNPDAADLFFAKPQMELATNMKPVDEDRDGLSDEDGPEDLNKDGQITTMRIADPDGDYITDPKEPRLMLKADRKKGEQGAWRVLSEGRDNDRDEECNEDGPGGVNLNRNFPYNYKAFAPWAGLHPVSEAETRALADFAVAHPNIAIVFTFGATDNLTSTPKAETPKRPPVAIHEEDISHYRDLGKAWREALGLKKEVPAPTEQGVFSDWMYFHRGRLALAARAWSPALPIQAEKGSKGVEEGEDLKKANAPNEKEEKTKSDKPGDKKEETENRNEEDRSYLKWVDKNAPEKFVAWKEYEHPDFPGKRVEIGGWAPFAKTNPPEKMLEELARKADQFLTALLGKMPRVAIRALKVKDLGNSIFDIEVQIENTGDLPTALAQGALTREVHPTRVVLHLDTKVLLAGNKTTLLGPIEGKGGRKEVRYTIQGVSGQKIELEVISMLGGTVRKTFALKEEK